MTTARRVASRSAATMTSSRSFAQHAADRVLTSVEVSGGDAELAVAVAGAGPPDQQQPVTLDQDAVDGDSGAESFGVHGTTVANGADDRRGADPGLGSAPRSRSRSRQLAGHTDFTCQPTAPSTLAVPPVANQSTPLLPASGNTWSVRTT